MNKKIISLLVVSALLIIPAIGLADINFGTPPDIQVDANQTASTTISNFISAVLDLIWVIFIAFAVIMFIIAGFQFLVAQGEPDGVKKAEKSVLWGAVGVAMGIVAFVLPFLVRNRLGL